MSTKRSEIERLRKEREKIEKQTGDLSQESWKHEQRISELKREIVLEEKLLNETIWKVVIRNTSYDCGSTFYLECEKGEPKAALDLCLDGWPHCGFHLSTDSVKNFAELREDDGDVSIHFSSDKVGLEFIRSQGLTVDASACESRMEGLRNSLKAYEALLEEFKK